MTREGGGMQGSEGMRQGEEGQERRGGREVQIKDDIYSHWERTETPANELFICWNGHLFVSDKMFIKGESSFLLLLLLY